MKALLGKGIGIGKGIGKEGDRNMQYIECSNNIIKMHKLYGKKPPTKEILEDYFEFLEEYTKEELVKAIKFFAKTSKFLPTISEISTQIEKQKEERKYEVLDYMLDKGYFKDSEYKISEYEKTKKFVDDGIAPNWFKEDYKKFLLEMKRGKYE